MEWIKGKPTKDGWYWFAVEGMNKADIFMLKGEEMLILGDSLRAHMYNWPKNSMWYCGPLEFPALPLEVSNG